MSFEKNGLTRRELLGGAAALGIGAPLSGLLHDPALRRKKVSPNDKVVCGLIGCGGMGASNMRTLMQFADFEVAALCDVDSDRVTNDYNDVNKKYNRKPEVFHDYRKMLERKDIDCVIIGTPDHWHALNLVHACEAGKDIYCEKPISYNITEAVTMVNAAKHHKRVVQVGTWQRSTQALVDAIEYVRSGKFGKVVLCRAWITDGFQAGKQQPVAVPKNLDYEMWTGPAAMVPYCPNHVHFNWRWFLNTGSGMSGDWGVHMIDIALLGMSKGLDLPMPVEASAMGGRFAYPDDDRTAPDTTEAIMRFKDPDFVLQWSILRDHPGKPGHGTEFVNASGHTLRVWRNDWILLDAEGKEMPKVAAAPVGDHWRNFLDCIKTREKPRADLASVAQTTIVCHLVNTALFSGETVHWDKAAMDIKGRAGKNTLSYHRDNRKPYLLPTYK